VLKKAIVGNQIQKQTNNAEHGEVNLQMNRACLCTQKRGRNLIEEIWYRQKNVSTKYKRDI